MRRLAVWLLAVVCLFVTANELFAAPAVTVLGKDYAFPNKIDGLPGKLSDFQVPSQRWMKSVIPDSTLYVYSKAEQGDHFLAFKNPVKFTADVEGFLQGKDANSPAAAGESNVTKETLLDANAAWNGASYVAYPAGRPELTVLRITVPAHGDLPWHSHPMPTAAYVVSGEITIEDKSGAKKHFSAGEVIPETVNNVHHGYVGDTPAVFIVFYPGTEGMPLSQAGQ